MAFEVPCDQIRELQISLRKEAGFASYNPDDPELPDLPSFEEAISELDPSPAYLRCKHCKGSLLRGINSVICTFCGRQQCKDVPPDPIKFTSTFGYRWFLHSLDLDGSELVPPSIEASESNRGQNTQEIKLPLSDLLDLEIRWPSEPEKFEIDVSESATAQRLSNLNLSGLDLDNFFTESKVDSVSASTIEQLVINEHEGVTGSNAFQGHENLCLFEHVKPSETVARSKEDISGDSFSGWEASFQSAGSGTKHQEPKLSDPFVGSSSVDLSSHMDAVFGSGKDLFDEKRKENSSLASNKNDWFEGDTWSNSNAGVAAKNNQFEVPINNKDQETMRKTNDSSNMNADRIEDNQWQTTTSSSRATDDGSFDAWSDFTSSTNAQVPSGISVEQASEINLFGGTNNSKDVDFGSSSQPDLFSTTLNNQNNSMVPESSISDDPSQPDLFSTTFNNQNNSMVPESSISDEMVKVNGRGGSAEVVDGSKNFSNGSTESKASDVEKLMSQMHDLSFMLESNLSVPGKNDSQDD